MSQTILQMFYNVRNLISCIDMNFQQSINEYTLHLKKVL